MTAGGPTAPSPPAASAPASLGAAPSGGAAASAPPSSTSSVPPGTHATARSTVHAAARKTGRTFIGRTSPPPRHEERAGPYADGDAPVEVDVLALRLGPGGGQVERDRAAEGGHAGA